MSSQPGPRPQRADDALTEQPRQRYIGDRDLTEWRSRAGRTLVGAAVRLATWAAPQRLLLITLFIGATLVAGLSTLAGAVYESVVEADGVATFDEPVLDFAIALRTNTGDAAVTALTDVGGGQIMPWLVTAITLAMAVAWRQWTPVLLVAATAAGSLAITRAGKLAVGRSRPPTADAVPPYEASFAFPSGHTLNSVALAGIIAYLLLRRQQSRAARAATVAAAGLFALAIGLSRVYLGHHWLTDVLVAWALGLAWLAIVVTAHRLFLTIRRQRTAQDG